MDHFWVEKTSNRANAGSFHQRIMLLAILFAILFLVVFGRLFQLQVVHVDQYRKLARGERTLEKPLPALRGPICDRFGVILAHDTPSYNLALRMDQARWETINKEEMSAFVEGFLEAQFRASARENLQNRLLSEPWVFSLSNRLARPLNETAKGVAGAWEAWARKWVSASTPTVILANVEQRQWEALRTVQEDIYRRDEQIPGLVCRFSLRRSYPLGSTAAHVLGALRELSPENLATLRRSGTLWHYDAERRALWNRQRLALTNAQVAELTALLGQDPRKLTELEDIFDQFQQLTREKKIAVARCGLSDLLRWHAQPPLAELTETERLWLNPSAANAHSRTLIDSRCGGTGVEAWYNNLLRGKQGLRLSTRYVGAGGKTVEEPHAGGEAREGAALHLTLSVAWQEAVEKALAGSRTAEACAAVVINRRTGEILAMASHPTFDPNLFIPPCADPTQRDAILEDKEKRKPQLNRCCAEHYPLGSVIKAMTAAVGLQVGTADLTETMHCDGSIELGRRTFYCDGRRAHGEVDLVEALRRSCNVYFYQLGAKIGVERLGPFAKAIGFGRTVGLDIFGEKPGIYPDLAWRKAHFQDQRQATVWTTGHEYQLAIGQGEFSATILQAACLMAAVAGDGRAVTPHLRHGAKLASQETGLDPRVLIPVRKGLDEVVNYGVPGRRGTAWTAFHNGVEELAIRVAGKTGTADHGRHGLGPHAWFAGYAPAAEDPTDADCAQIAFAVLIEYGGHGGAEAAPIVYAFLKEIYGTRARPNPNPGGPAAVLPNAHPSERSTMP